MNLNSMNTSIIKRLLGGKNSKSLQSILLKIEPQDLAQLFSLLNDHEARHLIDALISVQKAGETLISLPQQQLEELLPNLDRQRLTSIITHSAEDEASQFLRILNEDLRETILSVLPPNKKIRLSQLLSYPEESAGRLMTTDVFTLPTNMSAQEAIEKIRDRSQDMSIYYIYCVNEDSQLMGVISLRELVTAPAPTQLIHIIKREVVTVHTNTSEADVAQLVSHYDFIAVPVVDDQKKLKGLITVDDVVDIIQEQATADIYATAGLQEDDRIYSSVGFSVKNRLPWMILNLLTATIASFVVSRFEHTMNQLIILASLNSIVSGIGGNTGTQTLTVVTRGLATGDFNFITRGKVILKEMLTGTIVGSMIGFFAGILVYFWKDNIVVAVIICVSMILNSIAASFMGTMVPITLKKFNYDPASGSGVLVTFVTDSFGFFTFLGIATLALKYFNHSF